MPFLLFLPVAQVLWILDDGRYLFKDFTDTLVVEFRCAVIVIDTILLLLYVGNLGIAESYDVLAGTDGVDFIFKDFVKFFKSFDVLAVAP